jgi:hypothetical protein
MRDAEQVESQIHEMFQNLSRSPRGSVGGEWFEETPALMAYVESAGILISQAVPSLPDAESIIRLFVKE